MAYANLMVHMEVGRDCTGLLDIAGTLAARFHSNLTGIAACQPAQVIYGSEYLPSNIIDEQREEVEKGMQALELQFRNAIAKHTGSDGWRATVTYDPLADYLAREARIADLFITGVASRTAAFEARRSADIGELVLQIGRPILIVPDRVHSLKLDRVMLAWRDTREARLAASLALPILKAARQVFVVELVQTDEFAGTYANLKEVRTWLGMHGVMTEAMACGSKGNSAAELNAIAEKQQIDVVVAGAYGHSRLREAVLGGVTRDLLLNPQRCTLVAH